MPAKIIDFTAPHKRKTESEIEISKVEKMALDNKMSYGPVSYTHLRAHET